MGKAWHMQFSNFLSHLCWRYEWCIVCSHPWTVQKYSFASFEQFQSEYHIKNIRAKHYFHLCCKVIMRFSGWWADPLCEGFPLFKINTPSRCSWWVFLHMVHLVLVSYILMVMVQNGVKQGTCSLKLELAAKLYGSDPGSHSSCLSKHLMLAYKVYSVGQTLLLKCLKLPSRVSQTGPSLDRECFAEIILCLLPNLSPLFLSGCHTAEYEFFRLINGWNLWMVSGSAVSYVPNKCWLLKNKVDFSHCKDLLL